MSINPLRRAYERGLGDGTAVGRLQAVQHLRDQAAAHHGQVGDQRRRGALNAAADQIRDGRLPGRPV